MSDSIDETTNGPALAVSVALERDGKFLLVLRANPPAQRMYAFPGGRVEPGETLKDAALRELEEETGLKARNPRPFATFDLGSDDPGAGVSSQFLLTVFLVDDPGGEPQALDDAADVGWFAPTEIGSLPTPDSMVTCMNRLAAGEHRRQPE